MISPVRSHDREGSPGVEEVLRWEGCHLCSRPRHTQTHLRVNLIIRMNSITGLSQYRWGIKMSRFSTNKSLYLAIVEKAGVKECMSDG